MYLPSYYLSYLLFGVFLDLAVRPLSLVNRLRLGAVIAGLATLHWYLYSPLFFGWPINQAYCEVLRILPGMDWRCGPRSGVDSMLDAVLEVTAPVAQRT